MRCGGSARQRVCGIGTHVSANRGECRWSKSTRYCRVHRHFLACVWRLWERSAGRGVSAGWNRIPGCCARIRTDCPHNGIRDRSCLGVPFGSGGVSRACQASRTLWGVGSALRPSASRVFGGMASADGVCHRQRQSGLGAGRWLLDGLWPARSARSSSSAAGADRRVRAYVAMFSDDYYRRCQPFVACDCAELQSGCAATFDCAHALILRCNQYREA